MIRIPSENHVEVSTTLCDLELTYDSVCQKYLKPRMPLTLYMHTLTDSEKSMIDVFMTKCNTMYNRNETFRTKILIRMFSNRERYRILIDL